MNQININNLFEPGTIVETPHWGESIVIEDKETWLIIRYEAISHPDGKILWVLNSELKSKCKFISKPTEESIKILKLSGPYGL